MAADAIGRGAARLLLTAALLLLVVVAAVLVPISLGLPTPWQAVATFLLGPAADVRHVGNVVETAVRENVISASLRLNLLNAYADSKFDGESARDSQTGTVGQVLTQHLHLGCSVWPKPSLLVATLL